MHSALQPPDPQADDRSRPANDHGDGHGGGNGAVHGHNAMVPSATDRMAEVLTLLGSHPDAWSLACPVPLLRVRAGREVYAEGAEAQALYVVRQGSLKCMLIAEDGYEQVVGFATGGDVLGFEGMGRQGRQPMGVTALEDSSLLVLPLDGLAAWRRLSPALDTGLQRSLCDQLARAREGSTMMAAVASEVRLARFLVWTSRHMAAQGQSPRRFMLRMGRRDIASFLAVASETVSRGFGQLADGGLLKVVNRDVEILDMAGLLSRTRATRRETEEGRLKPRHRVPSRESTAG